MGLPHSAKLMIDSDTGAPFVVSGPIDDTPQTLVTAVEQAGGGVALDTISPKTVYMGAKPGDDITEELKTILSWVVAGDAIEIVIGIPGDYYINGAQQSGTYVSPQKTTLGVGVTLPASTITLASSAELPPCGEISIGGQTVKYMGISGNVLRNCTGGVGTFSAGTAVSTAHSYSGSVLLPALEWRYGKKTSITIRGAIKPTFGDPSTGNANGVRILTSINTADAYLFAAVPYSSQWGGNWTGVMPRFENLVFEFPRNPQAGAIDVRCCIHAEVDTVICGQGQIDSTHVPTGTTEAIRLPGTKNNGFVAARNVQIRSWGAGMRISEHTVLDNVQMSYCYRAFTAYGGGHPNWWSYVDLEECGVCIYLAPGVSNTNNGHLDIENVTPTTFWPTCLVEFGDSASALFGALDVMCNPYGSLGVKAQAGTAGQLSMELTNLTVPSSNTSQPVDTMSRLQGAALPAGSAPGLTWPTLDFWRVLSGQFQTSTTGELTNANAGSSSAYLAVRDGVTGGRSRRVQSTFVLPASSYDSTLVAHRQQTGANAVYARFNGGNLNVYVGANDTTGPVATISGITGSTTYTVAIEVRVENAKLVGFKVFLNDVLRYEHACSPSQQYTLAGSAPYLLDGLYIRDNGANVTKVTNYTVAPVDAAGALVSGVATLVAGASTIAMPSVSGSARVRLSRQAAGGTLGQLSVVVTAGTGLQINSSSSSETSTVLWELVQA